MGIVWVEVCLISAHGLQHPTTLWKRRWFAVVWIDLNSKYCTKVDDSGNANPIWRTKFAIPVDDSAPNFKDLALNVEVYSMDPIFLTEKLHGSATIVLREFLDRQLKNSKLSKARHGEVGSYQLRKKKSSTPRGFIDISIRISEDKKGSNSRRVSYAGSKGGPMLLDHGTNSHLTLQEGLELAYPQKQLQGSFHQTENHVETNIPDSESVSFLATNYYDPHEGEPSYYEVAGPNYQSPRTITPPPPPSNVGYIPTFLPRNDGLPPSYTHMPQYRAAPGQRGPPGFAMGLGAGAIAAGAVIFGDDFMSGFDVPPGLGDANHTLELDDPY